MNTNTLETMPLEELLTHSMTLANQLLKNVLTQIQLSSTAKPSIQTVYRFTAKDQAKFMELTIPLFTHFLSSPSGSYPLRLKALEESVGGLSFFGDIYRLKDQQAHELGVSRNMHANIDVKLSKLISSDFLAQNALIVAHQTLKSVLEMEQVLIQDKSPSTHTTLDF